MLAADKSTAFGQDVLQLPGVTPVDEVTNQTQRLPVKVRLNKYKKVRQPKAVSEAYRRKILLGLYRLEPPIPPPPRPHF